MNLYYFASPATFYPLAGKLVPWFALLAAALCAVGLYISFFVAPTDFQQGEGYRIIFIHVPAAWMSMFIYVVMAFWSAIGLAWNTRLSFVMARALAPTGAILIGTPALSGIGAIGAALTLGLRGGGVLLSLLVLPLYIPVLIFGAGAVVARVTGLGGEGHLSLLAALTLASLAFAPWAAAAALKIALE